jgi:pimeloyl-ACP methyl ester carboxylesterase
MGHLYGLGMWHRVRPALEARYRVICFDNRGIGRSARKEGPHSIADMADDAFAVLDAAGVDSAHVYGASMGGLIVQEMALSHPERVRSLVLACTGCPSDDTASTGPGRGWRYRIPKRVLTTLGRRSMFGAHVPKEIVDEDIRILNTTKTSVAALIEQSRAIAAYRSFDRVGDITCPTLVLHGTRDTVVDFTRGAELAERIPAAVLHPLEGAGHNYPTDATDAANGAVLAFLGDLAVR